MKLTLRLLWIIALALLPLHGWAADKVVVQLQHTDAMSIMGQTTPAQDITQESWFGDSAVRFDRSMTRVPTKGPRSLTRTTTSRPLSRLVTFT